MPVSTPFNGITYISAASHLLPLLELFAMQRVCSPPALPLGEQQGEDQGRVARAGREEEENRADTFSRCSMDRIGYPSKVTEVCRDRCVSIWPAPF